MSGQVVKAVEGFFRAKVAQNAADLSLFNKFEKVPASWREFQRQIDARPQKPKVVFFVRHAQGTHNAADRAYGPGWWKSAESRIEELFDPDLTQFGVEDAKAKGPPSIRAELQRGMPPIERVVVSPLSRAIQTAQHFCANEVQTQQFLCLESCREILDCYYFDKRRNLAELRAKFPKVDFSLLKDEEDALWTVEHDETREEMEVRAQEFLTELFDKVDEQFVVVVSHLCFMQALYRVATGSRLDHSPQNCEVVPLVLEVK